MKKIFLCFIVFIQSTLAFSQNTIKWGISLDGMREWIFSRETHRYNYLSLDYHYTKPVLWPGFGAFIEAPSYIHDKLSLMITYNRNYRSSSFLVTNEDPKYTFPLAVRGHMTNRVHAIGLSPAFTIFSYLKIHGGYQVQFHRQLHEKGLTPHTSMDFANDAHWVLMDKVKHYNIQPILHNLSCGAELQFWRIGLNYTVARGLNNIITPIPFEETVFYAPSQTVSHWLSLKVYLQGTIKKKMKD